MSKGLSVAVGGLALVIVGASLAAVMPRTSNEGFAPSQPIPFSHKVHAGDNKIPCQYCHSDVEKSRHASGPSTSVCMNCHRVVLGSDTEIAGYSYKEWIQKVRDAWDQGRAIEWTRVHELPDFVYFPHKRHVAAGLACQTCHGQVQGMDTVYQFAPLTMGWCMECHRGRSTPNDVLSRIEAKGWPNGEGQAAPTQCSTCHY
jgi:hypothetical protein